MVEPDYPTAAVAWMIAEMSKETMRHRDACILIAHEYSQRLEAEARDRSSEDVRLKDA